MKKIPKYNETKQERRKMRNEVINAKERKKKQEMKRMKRMKKYQKNVREKKFRENRK